MRVKPRWVAIAACCGWFAAVVPVAAANSSGVRACAAYTSSPEASGLPAVFADGGCSWVGRVIRDSGIGVAVPARGEEVRLDALGLAGSRSMVVAHTADGQIRIGRDSGARAKRAGAPSTPLPSCSDGAFSAEGFTVSGGYSFSYNGYAAPSNVSSGAASAVATAFINAASAATDCSGATRHKGPPAHYLGAVSGQFANVSTHYDCTSPDASNTVSWLTGNDHTLALTCMWSSGGVLRYSDAVINRSLTFFTGPVPAGCSSAADLVGVMTHEAGHTYGLGHADEGSGDPFLHSNQTMNSHLATCTTKFRTLGTGDLNGMTFVY